MIAEPETRSRITIDAALAAAGWAVQDAGAVNLWERRGVAVREFSLKPGHGEADYLLFVDRQAVGVVEAKAEGATLKGVEVQSAKYGEGLPDKFKAPVRPLPFLYESTGVETQFTNGLDPEPRSRRVFAFHRPETLADWVADALADPAAPTLRARLRRLPPLIETGLWPAQGTAVRNLEASFAADRPRALVQMATGSGKTFTAITAIYRLVKFGGAKRVLFLVDRANLGRQTLKEFQTYVTPDDGRAFTELYNVQLLGGPRIDPVARVCIGTIQRLYAMLRGEDLDPEAEEASAFSHASRDRDREPLPLPYNPELPPEAFDIVFTDECHRSIYNLWRQVLEYFDASLVELTATPSKQTFGFFRNNLVMEYGHEQAVADGVNVGFDVYRIETAITAGGSRVEADHYVDKRDRLSRKVRWELLEDELVYDARELDRGVVAVDQIRTIVRTFRDKLPTEIFPGRTEVPKTLIFAKDDSHADDIVQIVREEFGRGNEFCQKITYKTTGAKPEELLAAFRNSYNPRVVVTVDMIATGTDIKPLEIVVFMRSVKSRNFFEQMKGRGVRVIDDSDLKGVTPDAAAKTHFVIVDAVGVTEGSLVDSQPLEKKRSVAFEALLQDVALGIADEETISSLAGRLARLDRQLGEPDRKAIAEAAGGPTLRDLVAGLVAALDPDAHMAAARAAAGLPPNEEPTAEQTLAAKEQLLTEAAKPLAANPALRQKLVETKTRFEQTIDTVSLDELVGAGFSAAAAERARGLVGGFEAYLEEHKDEIAALQILYARPYGQRLRYKEIKALAEAIQAPPRAWTPEALWQAYEMLDKRKVRGSGGKLLTDIVSLVRFALGLEDELVPYPERVAARYAAWLAQQEAGGRRFTLEQRRWLDDIRDHVAASLTIEAADFDDSPFSQRGGLGRVYEVFGPEFSTLLDELNEALAA